MIEQTLPGVVAKINSVPLLFEYVQDSCFSSRKYQQNQSTVWSGFVLVIHFTFGRVKLCLGLLISAWCFEAFLCCSRGTLVFLQMVVVLHQCFCEFLGLPL